MYDFTRLLLKVLMFGGGTGKFLAYDFPNSAGTPKFSKPKQNRIAEQCFRTAQLGNSGWAVFCFGNGEL